MKEWRRKTVVLSLDRAVKYLNTVKECHVCTAFILRQNVLLLPSRRLRAGTLGGDITSPPERMPRYQTVLSSAKQNMESLQWPNAGSTTGFRGHCVLRESRRLQHLLLEQIERHVAARTPSFPSITLRCWNHTIKAVQVKSTKAKIRDWSAISSQITQESEGMSPSLWNTCTQSDFCIKAWKLALQNYNSGSQPHQRNYIMLQ